MKINIIFFLFFMLSDSMEIFIPLYFKKNGLSAVTYGSLQSVTTILRMAVIWIMAKPKMKNKRRILELFVEILGCRPGRRFGREGNQGGQNNRCCR